MALSPEERETIITFDQSSKVAVIFTYQKKIQRHLEKKLGLKPISVNSKGGKEYEIDKKRIPMPRAPRKTKAMTPEAKSKLVKRLNTGKRKSSLSSQTTAAAIKQNVSNA